MKRNCFLLALGLTVCTAHLHGQDVTPLPALPPRPAENPAAAVASRQEAEENYNALKGQIDDLIAANADSQKQIQEMRKEIDDLRSQLAKPQGNYASADDLKQLAAAVDDLNKKREADKQLILHEMEKLGHVVANVPDHTPVVRAPPHHDDTPPSTNQEGYYYKVKSGDNFKKIAQYYRDQHIMVTSRQIIAANSNIDPNKLLVGQTVFIPAPKSDAK
jgi:septal ring factor EnvC (AmiA/AmiB activator)